MGKCVGVWGDVGKCVGEVWENVLVCVGARGRCGRCGEVLGKV